MKLASLLLALAAFPGLRPPAPDVQVLTGVLTRAGGGGVAGRVEVHFAVDSGGPRDGHVLETVEAGPDGKFRVEVPERAYVGFLRATVAGEVHYGPRAWLVDRRGTEYDLGRFELDPLMPAAVSVVGLDGRPADTGEVFFLPDRYASDTGLLTDAERRCYSVARLDGGARLDLPPLPRGGGALRVEVAGAALHVEPLTLDSARGRFDAHIALTPAASLQGKAPTAAAFGDGGPVARVVIAAMGDALAGNEPGAVATCCFRGAQRMAPFIVGVGDEFEALGVCAYAPVLGAWPHGRSRATDPPALVARRDRRTGLYTDWVPVGPARYRVDLSAMRAPERRRLEGARFWGNLVIRTTGGSAGHGLKVRVDGDVMEVVCEDVCPIDGQGVLQVHTGGVQLFAEDVPTRPGWVEVEPRTLVATTEVAVHVRDAETGAPVPGVRVDAFAEDEEDWQFGGPLVELTCDDEGRGAALFRAGTRIRLVPDRSRYRLAKGGELVVDVEGFAQALTLDVVQALGSVRVTAGAIDDQPFRVSLVPEEDVGVEEYVSIRADLPVKGKSVPSWEVERVGREVAAVLVRPGAEHLFEAVPEGRYVVTVQTGLDLGARSVYVDTGAATHHRLARRIEVRRGEVTDVLLAPGRTVEARFSVLLPKADAKALQKRLRAGERPRAEATLCTVGADVVQPSEGARPIPLAWDEDGVLVGSLEEGAAYVLHLSGVGAADSAHVVVAAAGDPVPVALDGAVELDLSGGKGRKVEVEVTARPHSPEGAWVLVELPRATLELSVKGGKVLVSGLSPDARHALVVRQGDRSAELDLGPLKGDAEAERDRRSGALLRELEVRLR